MNLRGESSALLAERTLVGILDLDGLLQLVDAEDFSWALGHELLLLLHGESPVHHLVVEANHGLLAHGTGGDWGPLGMRLTDTLLGHHAESDLLVLAEHHETNGILIAIIIFVGDR